MRLMCRSLKPHPFNSSFSTSCNVSLVVQPSCNKVQSQDSSTTRAYVPRAAWQHISSHRFHQCLQTFAASPQPTSPYLMHGCARTVHTYVSQLWVLWLGFLWWCTYLVHWDLGFRCLAHLTFTVCSLILESTCNTIPGS
jgi:hypothetical protein